ncbi:MAG: 3-hydroxybutyryl-CoA dehydrogenase [Actinobacteria bacterium]|nr:3-hydroxybutyryl-CoA dehydrogenase [Actinomycetota bacterium]
MKDKKICIIGSGTMGAGIAQVCAQSGMNVFIYDKDCKCVDKCMEIMEKNLQKAAEKGKIRTGDIDNTLGRISKILNMEELPDRVNFVVEAAVEDLSVKKSIFKNLDEKYDSSVILATNTSSLSITEIASVTKKQYRVIGIHFFNPVQVMNLVEIIRGIKTSDNVFLKSKKFIEELGKTPVEVKDSPGFIVNRLLIPMINEAANILDEGISGREDIDAAMKLGANHPIGPLALADLIGLDICLKIMQVLYKGFSDSKYRPSPLIVRMVKEGFLGRKSKKGFYEYN